MAKRTDQEMTSESWRRQLNERLRLAFIARSEERWQTDQGRPMTDEELRRVLRRYPGDLPES
jgi:hypothetical protein